MEDYLNVINNEEILSILSWDKQNLLETFRRCQTHEMGGRILVCDECGNKVVKYYPCNKRGCFKCAPINQKRWQEKTKRHVLPTGHFHQVFKVPTDTFYYVWKHDEKKFINTLFRSVQKAYKEEMKHMGITPGILMVFQSHGEGLSIQLHMHCVVTMGGITESGNWVPIKKLNEKRLEANYKEYFYAEVSKNYKEGYWNTLRPLLLNDEREKLTVYTTYHQENAEAVINYLSKSLCGLVVAPKDLRFDIEKLIAHIRNPRKETETDLSQREFIRRFLEHIPMDGEVLVRHYGLYSNLYKEKREHIREKVFNCKNEESEETGHEVCSECGSPLRVETEFEADRLPLVIRLQLNKGSPPKHGELLVA